MRHKFPVVEIFDSIDGEGKRTGYMAIFIRFAGCNLRCTYCDTSYALCSSDASIFPTKEEAEACLALAQLCQLRDRYNEGWKPHWEDYNETKYCIEFCQGRIETIDRVNCHKILTFKTEDLRDKFLENFKDLIETAKPLL